MSTRVGRVTIYPTIAEEARRASTDQRAQIAHQIADDARADAPVLTGRFRDSIQAVIAGDDVHVEDSDPAASYIEYGTSTHPAHAALTNAARAYGRYSGWQPRGG